MPYIINGDNQSAIYRGTESEFLIYFPNLTGSSEWFQIYTNVTSSNGYVNANANSAPPPIPSNLIYEYTASVGTVYSSSYFVGVPTVTINNIC